MKSAAPLFRTLLLGSTVVCVGILILFRFDRSENRDGPSQGEPPLPLRPKAAFGKSLEAPELETERPSFSGRRLAAASLRETQALIHAKLRQWRETHTGESEIQDNLTKELQALLTNDYLVEIIQSLSSEELSTPFGAEALDRWLTVDVRKASTWLGARSDATEAQAWLVARKLSNDPATLRAFCDELPASPWKESLLSGAGLNLTSKDPAEAIGLAQRMNPGPAQTNLFQTVAYDWTGRDPDAALRWIMGVNDVALREQLIAVGAKAIAAADPDLGMKWLLSAVKTESILKDTALSIVETWASQDPAKAANWVASFPAQDARAAAVDIVVRQWTQADPAAANAWIQRLPERNSVLAKLKADQAARAPDPGY